MMHTEIAKRNLLIRLRAKDNAVIKTMTDSQHRAISILVLHTQKISDYHKPLSLQTHRSRLYRDFFIHSLPIMLRTSGLPNLDLTEEFSSDVSVESIAAKVNHYLRYIDKKYGTFYEIADTHYAA